MRAPKKKSVSLLEKPYSPLSNEPHTFENSNLFLDSDQPTNTTTKG